MRREDAGGTSEPSGGTSDLAVGLVVLAVLFALLGLVVGVEALAWLVPPGRSTTALALVTLALAVVVPGGPGVVAAVDAGVGERAAVVVGAGVVWSWAWLPWLWLPPSPLASVLDAVGLSPVAVGGLATALGLGSILLRRLLGTLAGRET